MSYLRLTKTIYGEKGKIQELFSPFVLFRLTIFVQANQELFRLTIFDPLS